MAEWTMAFVQDRLELAAEVFRALPNVKPQGYFSAWPEYFHSFADQVGQEPRMRKPLPSPRMITEAEQTLLWLRWVLLRIIGDPESAVGQCRGAQSHRSALFVMPPDSGLVAGGGFLDQPALEKALADIANSTALARNRARASRGCAPYLSSAGCGSDQVEAGMLDP